MILLEVFNNPYSYSLRKHIKGTNYEEYIFYFKASNNDPINVYIVVEIDSDETDGDGTLIYVGFDRNEEDIGITNSGDAYRIFATVIDILRVMVNKYKPDVIKFSASKVERESEYDLEGTEVGSRIRLYDRMVNRFASSFGYSSSFSDKGDEKVYYLEKK